MNNADFPLQKERANLPVGKEGGKLKVLVIQQKMIGDVLISTVICEALKKKYPSATVHYLVNSNTIPVIEGNPFIDQILEFKDEYSKSRKALLKFARKIRTSKYDVVVDAYGKWESNLVTLFSGAWNKTSYHKWYTSFIYTKTIQKHSKPSYGHSIAIENRIRLIFPENEVPVNIVSPKIYLRESEKKQARSLLENNTIDLKHPLFMVSVLGSTEIKTYPAAYMANLLDQIILKRPKAQLLFNYMPNQFKEAQEIYDLTTQKTKDQIFLDLYAKNIREFLAITSYCNALIGNEGGATNMAKAMKIPTFVIFSPYLKKSNWFGASDDQLHEAVHLSDFLPYRTGDLEKAKKDPKTFYLKFKPTFIHSKLEDFLNRML